MKKKIYFSHLIIRISLTLCFTVLFVSNHSYALDATVKDTGDIKLGLAVDLNRDGFVDLEDSQPGVDDGGLLTGKKVNDKTTAKLPYRFWINNDLDVVSDQSDFNYDNAIDLNVTNCSGKNPSFNPNPELGEAGYRQVCEQWDEDPT